MYLKSKAKVRNAQDLKRKEEQAFYECAELIRCDNVHKSVGCENVEKAHKK